MRAGKRACWLHGRIQGHRCEVLGFYFTGITFYLYITETKESKMRFKNVFFSIKYIGGCCFGGTQVFGIEVSVLVQYFSMFYYYAVAAIAFCFYFNPAYQVLTEVEHRFATRCF